MTKFIVCSSECEWRSVSRGTHLPFGVRVPQASNTGRRRAAATEACSPFRCASSCAPAGWWPHALGDAVGRRQRSLGMTRRSRARLRRPLKLPTRNPVREQNELLYWHRSNNSRLLVRSRVTRRRAVRFMPKIFIRGGASRLVRFARGHDLSAERSAKHPRFFTLRMYDCIVFVMTCDLFSMRRWSRLVYVETKIVIKLQKNVQNKSR